MLIHVYSGSKKTGFVGYDGYGISTDTKGNLRLGIDSGKISTGKNVKWNQATLTALAKRWKKSWPTFPFRSEYKPIGKDIGYIDEHHEEASKAIATACSKEDKKPSFSDPEAKNGDSDE